MIHRLAAAFAWFFTVFLMTPSSAAAQSVGDGDQSRPNILILLADDLGYGDLGCFGHPHIQTDHLDALAAGGLRLTDCYAAAPVCSPSRVGLLTGRSPNRAGVFDWIPEVKPGRVVDNPDDPKHAHRRALVHMRVGEVTMATVLKRAGYQTAMIGKYHCNSRFNSSVQPGPGDHGFEHWIATQNNASPSHHQPRNFVANGNPVGRVDRYSSHYVADEAIRWLESNSSSPKPFFLYLPFHEPHLPIASPPELVDRYLDVATNPMEAEYFANVHNLDLAIGRIIDHLRRTSQLDDTLIFFTSDNGPETLDRYPSATKCYGSAGNLRGRKLHTHDGGLKVPGIVHWPAKIEGSRTSHHVFSSLDLMPTLCTLAGATPPDRPLDGMDQAAFLASPLGPTPRSKPLVWTFFNALNQPQVAMRLGRYKVLATIDDLPRLANLTEGLKQTAKQKPLVDYEIYDVTTDVAERNNLLDGIESSPDLCQTLRQHYHALLNDSHAW